MVKDPIQHFDKLGVELFPGDYVVVPWGPRQTMIARIVKLTPKMITICKVNGISNNNTYPNETVKLDPNLVTMYILKSKK